MTSTVALASAVPVSAGVVFLVRLSVLLLPVSLAEVCARPPVLARGAVVSMVNGMPLLVVALPAASVTVMTGV